MPRDGSNVYSKASASFVPSTIISSAAVNADIDDLVTDANTARAIVAGGTGQTTALGAHDALVIAGSTVASAATVALDAVVGPLVDISGTAAITAITLGNGKCRFVRATGAFVLTASAGLIVNGSNSVAYTATADDLFMVQAYAGVQHIWKVGGSGSVNLGTTIHALAAKATPVDADQLAMADSANTFLGAVTTYLQAWTNYFKAKADALYQPLATALTNFVTLVGTIVAGDIIYGSGAATLARLPKGSNTQVLTLAAGLPTWAAGGQPIPASSTYAVGTVIQGVNGTGGTIADGSTIAGSSLTRVTANQGNATVLGSAVTGTWTNVWGAGVGSGSAGYFVRTA